MPLTKKADVIAMRPKADSPRPASTLRFYGEEFVFDTASGMFYRMSPTACFILRELDAGVPVRDLETSLEKRYGLDRATAARDVELFLNDVSSLEPLNRLHPSND